MHLAQRAYVLLALAAVLAIAAIWSNDPQLAGLWRWPLGVLLIGVVLESVRLTRARPRIELRGPGRAWLGRPLRLHFRLRNPGPSRLLLEYAPLPPQGFEPAPQIRRITLPPHAESLDPCTLLPVGLGTHAWPPLPARTLGHLGLLWWNETHTIARRIRVAPDALRSARAAAAVARLGRSERSAIGAGAELHQLRPYVPGDPLARIDWKATARLGALVSREMREQQHLEVLLAIDAGGPSRVRTGRLEPLALYANVAARLAACATPHEDRVGLLVFADRALAELAPTRGHAATARITRLLEALPDAGGESDPIAAALRIRSLLHRRSLVIVLTRTDDPALTGPLVRAVRLLNPPHLVVLAGLEGPGPGGSGAAGAALEDPWVALAAQARAQRAAHARALLRRLGAPVVCAREELLGEAVLASYESLRRSRRI